MKPSPLPWQILLQSIIRSPSERQRLSSVLGVTNMTLSRWASGESKPQRPHLLHLVQAIQPHLKPSLLHALEQSYPDLQIWLAEETATHIRSDFFAQVLSLRTLTSDTTRFWRMSDLILKEMLAQLDPNKLGMAVKLIQCMPPHPHNGKIHSLRERAGKGTPPWNSDLEHDILFLGMESMCGYSVEVRHMVSDPDLRKNMTFPAYQDDYEMSAAAHPIRFENHIAGCLLASSTQIGYFSQQRLDYLGVFSNLIALAFDKKDFYPSQLIGLRPMPKPDLQRPILATFRQRATNRMLQKQPSYTNSDIEISVWQEIEEELIALQQHLYP